MVLPTNKNLNLVKSRSVNKRINSQTIRCMTYFEHEEFSMKTVPVLENTDFYQCTFKNIDFTDFTFRNARFENCLFQSCSIPNSFKHDTKFIDCEMKECKATGCDFTRVSQTMFSMHFEKCSLNYSTFAEMDLRSCSFVGSILDGADLTSTRLNEVDLSEASLLNTDFSQADLSKANLTRSIINGIDPRTTKLKGITINQSNLIHLLGDLDIQLSDA